MSAVIRQPPDAIVIGSGPNGLVAANHLADAGWSVLVLEAALTPGGAVRSAEVTAPGFTNDLYSAFYPLAVGSPAIASLGLERHGLRWAHAPAVSAHPMPDGPAPLIFRDRALTAANLDARSPGDGAAWLELMDRWDESGRLLLATLVAPFPPVRSAARLAWNVRSIRGFSELARTALSTVRALGGERFTGDAPSALLAGLALHADLPPDAPASGLFGWVMAGLAQTVGFPVPVGGAGALAAALVARLESKGGEVRCGTTVEGLTRRDGRVTGVVTSAGAELPAARAVLADVALPFLYGRLIERELLDDAARRDLDRFDPGLGTVKVDWALGAPIPWTDEAIRAAGTVHLGGTLDEQSVTAARVAAGQTPDEVLAVVGQMTTTDSTRSPAGTESAWAYTHVPSNHPRVTWTSDDTARVAAMLEAEIERLAPGFGDRILARHVVGPHEMESANPNLIGGAIGGGTSMLHQQAIWRPSSSWGRPETPLRGLYLASASAHPGGGVHGAPGRNAAAAAIAHDRWRRRR